MNLFEELLTKIMEKFLRLFMRESQKKTIPEDFLKKSQTISEGFLNLLMDFKRGFYMAFNNICLVVTELDFTEISGNIDWEILVWYYNSSERVKTNWHVF